MAELVDDPHRHGDEEEDGEKGGGGVGKRGRGRGRPAVGDGAGGGRGGAEGEREEDPLVFCPLLKYEGSGRLLDMAPDAQFEEGGAESSAGAAGLKVMRAPCAFRVSYSRFQRWLQILAWSIETVCILCLPRLLTSYARAHARTHAHTHTRTCVDAQNSCWPADGGSLAGSARARTVQDDSSWGRRQPCLPQPDCSAWR